MLSGLKRILDSILRRADSIRYEDAGNRSIVHLDYCSYLRDPHLVRLFTEYRATGNFTGHLSELSGEEVRIVSQIKAGLQVLSQMQDRYAVGTMWAKFNEQMLRNALEADARLYNHVGALCYKTFKPLDMGLEAVIREVLKILVIYDQLIPHVQRFEGLFVSLNSPFFTLDGHKLNSGIRAVEEWSIVQEKVGSSKMQRVLEIGAGSGQLTNLFLRDGAKVVVIDLPGMHSRGPYFLYKSGHRVCTYDRYLQAGRDVEGLFRQYDVIYLPPWEAESLVVRFDLAVNVHSLGEMAIEEAVRYLQLIDRICDCFISLNTNTRGLDPVRQPEYVENSSLQYSKHLSMKPVATGTTISDSVFGKILHNGYVVYRKGNRPEHFPAYAPELNPAVKAQ